MTTIAIITMSAGWQWVIEQVGTFSDDKQALAFVNLHARKWVEENRGAAFQCHGRFEITTAVKQINGIPEFRWLRYTPYMEANDGEEVWMAVLDRESQARIYAETQPEFDAEADKDILHTLPEGVTVIRLNPANPAQLHDFIKNAVGE